MNNKKDVYFHSEVPLVGCDARGAGLENIHSKILQFYRIYFRFLSSPGRCRKNLQRKNQLCSTDGKIGRITRFS